MIVRWCSGLLFLMISVVAQAEIIPLLIEVQFKLGDWRPLPEDKIKTAAVDSALSEISKTRRYAFFTTQPEAIKTGKLTIKINLVEAAQTATISIMLQQPNGGTINSIQSESLKNKNYDGIYNAFELAGKLAGEKIALIAKLNNPHAEKKETHQDEKRVAYLERQVIQINNKIINQSNHSSAVRNEAKLEFVLQELRSINKQYDKLAKQEDLQKQGKKIDTVLVNLTALNKKIDDKPVTQINLQQSYILENAYIGQTRINKAKQAGLDEEKAQVLYEQSQQFKRNKKFAAAEEKLTQGMKLRISPELRSLLYDELIYTLPMFEAQSYTFDLASGFQNYSHSGQDKIILKKISGIYHAALKNNRGNFQRTREIQRLIDQQISTQNYMGNAVAAQNKASAYQIRQFMQMQIMMEGSYPNSKRFKSMMKQHGLHFDVLKYNTDSLAYKVTLKSTDGGVYLIEADQNNFSIKEKQTVNQ